MSSKVDNLLQSLENLKNLNYGTPEVARSSHAKVENLLDLIFDIGRKNIKFTKGQQQIVGCLLLKAIRPIKINIERTGCQYRTSLESSVLRKRSAIQFLVENYGNFPVEGGVNLSEKLATSNIRESISILDNIISKWRDVSDSDEADTNRGIIDVPVSHTWWFS